MSVLKIKRNLRIVVLNGKNSYDLMNGNTLLFTFVSTRKKDALTKAESAGKDVLKFITSFLQDPKKYFADLKINEFKTLHKSTISSSLTPRKAKSLVEKLSKVLSEIPKEYRTASMIKTLATCLNKAQEVRTPPKPKTKQSQRLLTSNDKEIIAQIRKCIRELNMHRVTLAVKDDVIVITSRLSRITPTVQKRLEKYAPNIVSIVEVESASYYKYNVMIENTKVVQNPVIAVANKRNALKEQASKQGSHSVALNLELNGKSKSNDKVFGYWRPSPMTGKSGLPFPVAMKVKGYTFAEFKPKLNAWIRKCRTVEYKGHAINRWTGAKAGAAEFQLNGWRMPSGALSYLSKGVPPTQEFYKEVTGKTNLNLPSAKKYY